MARGANVGMVVSVEVAPKWRRFGKNACPALMIIQRPLDNRRQALILCKRWASTQKIVAFRAIIYLQKMHKSTLPPMFPRDHSHSPL
jgi:hypothetical protein